MAFIMHSDRKTQKKKGEEEEEEEGAFLVFFFLPLLLLLPQPLLEAVYPRQKKVGEGGDPPKASPSARNLPNSARST